MTQPQAAVGGVGEERASEHFSVGPSFDDSPRNLDFLLPKTCPGTHVLLQINRWQIILFWDYKTPKM